MAVTPTVTGTDATAGLSYLFVERHLVLTVDKASLPLSLYIISAFARCPSFNHIAFECWVCFNLTVEHAGILFVSIEHDALGGLFKTFEYLRSLLLYLDSSKFVVVLYICVINSMLIITF